MHALNLSKFASAGKGVVPGGWFRGFPGVMGACVGVTIWISSRKYRDRLYLYGLYSA